MPYPDLCLWNDIIREYAIEKDLKFNFHNFTKNYVTTVRLCQDLMHCKRWSFVLSSRIFVIVDAVVLLLTCFYIDLQLFTTAFKNLANFYFHMVLDFTMKWTVAIVYFILFAINITYYNPTKVSTVKHFHEFSFLFLEH